MTKKKSSQLDKYRIDKLNEIGFQWSLQNYTVVSWDDRFEVGLAILDTWFSELVALAPNPFILCLPPSVLWPGLEEVQGKAWPHQDPT